MSLKTEFEDAAYKAGGSTKTIDTRCQTVAAYARWCRTQNIQTRHVADVKARHVGAYINNLRERGISDRTCQNRMAHLRAAIKAVGGRNMPTNQQLSIDGAPRSAARTAMTHETYATARRVLAGHGHEGARAALALQRTLGLRAGEAIQSWRSLTTWQRQLERSAATITVLHGTKGGRPRDSHPVDRKTALAAIQEARAACKANCGKLIAGKTLTAARSRYERQCRNAGLSGKQAPHSARYAYARDRLAAYVKQGFDLREAKSAVSQDLGHGSGRDRWVSQIYLR